MRLKSSHSAWVWAFSVSSGASWAGTTVAPVVVSDDDVAGHDEGVAAGDGHVDCEGEDVGLGVEVGGGAAQPKPDVEVFEHLGKVADAAVDDCAAAAAPHEEGEHHLAEDAAVHVAARIDDDDVAGLGVVQGVAVELFFWVGVFIDRVYRSSRLGMNCKVRAGPTTCLPGVRATGPWMWGSRMPKRASSPAAVALEMGASWRR